MRLNPGDVIDDKYEIVRLLGQGGMGIVYEGAHRRIHQRVAIKVLHSSIATDDVIVTRFEHEAQAAGRIGSDHIVKVLDVGRTPRGERYMVMEYLEGESLHDRLSREGPLLPEQCFPIAIELLEGLEAAHRAGIIHRDLKPENIWLSPARRGSGDFVKVLDFGVSKFRLGGADVTHTGVVVGTPAYMAPEQATAERDVDPRADLYVVGVILFRCLAGQVPYEGATYNELMYKLAIEEPPPLSQVLPGVDPGVEEIVRLATQRDRDARYSDARSFRAALEQWLQAQGFPVSLAVAGLLQSGDRVAAELLQSGDRHARPQHQGVFLDPDGETIPMEEEKPSPSMWDDDSETAVRPLSHPPAPLPPPPPPPRDLALPDEAPRVHPDHTTAIAEERLAAMSLADQLESGAHLPVPEPSSSSDPLSRSVTPPTPPRTVPIVFAAITLVIGLVVGIGVATLADDGHSTLQSRAAEILRIATEAERASGPRE